MVRSQRDGSLQQSVLQVVAGWCFLWRPPACPRGAPPYFESFVALRDPWGFQAHSCLLIHKLAARGRLMTQLRGLPSHLLLRAGTKRKHVFSNTTTTTTTATTNINNNATNIDNNNIDNRRRKITR